MTARRLPGKPGRAAGSRLLETCLWAVSLCCASYCLVLYGRSQSMLHQPVPASSLSSATSVLQPGSLIAHLDIPAIELSVPVLEDDETQSLQRGVGHIPSTAFPGGLGTVGLAGHRDTFLRPLSKIEPRMEIRLTDAHGTFRYIVDSTEIVLPSAVSVLATADQPALVIVTCYPFHYIGAAPKRFIVHAHLVSVLPG